MSISHQHFAEVLAPSAQIELICAEDGILAQLKNSVPSIIRIIAQYPHLFVGKEERLIGHESLNAEYADGIEVILRYDVQRPFLKGGMSSEIVTALQGFQDAFFNKPSQFSKRNKPSIEEKIYQAMERLGREVRQFVSDNSSAINSDDYKALLMHLDNYDVGYNRLKVLATQLQASRTSVVNESNPQKCSL